MSSLWIFWGVRHVGSHCFSFRAGILLTTDSAKGRNCIQIVSHVQHICWQCLCLCSQLMWHAMLQEWGCGIQNVVSDFVRRHHTFNETWNSEILGVSFLWWNCRTCKKHTSFYCLNFIGQAQNPLRTKELSLSSIRTRSSSIARWFGNMTASCSCLQGCQPKKGSQNVKRFEVN